MDPLRKQLEYIDRLCSSFGINVGYSDQNYELQMKTWLLCCHIKYFYQMWFVSRRIEQNCLNILWVKRLYFLAL